MENKITLYEVAEAFKNVEDMVEENADLVVYLDSVEMQLKDKVVNIIKLDRNLTLSVEAIDSEIERLSAIKKHYSSVKERLENYISYSMQNNGIEKIETDIARLSFRKSETVEVENVELLPEKFIVTKVSKSADKKAIKEALKNGEEVTGAKIESHNNLQIK